MELSALAVVTGREKCWICGGVWDADGPRGGIFSYGEPAACDSDFTPAHAAAVLSQRSGGSTAGSCGIPPAAAAGDFLFTAQTQDRSAVGSAALTLPWCRVCSWGCLLALTWPGSGWPGSCSELLLLQSIREWFGSEGVLKF